MTLPAVPATVFAVALTHAVCPWAGAVNYEVYPGSAFYLTQMVDRVTWSFVADHANGFYFHPVGFTANSDYPLSEAQKQAICDHFSNRLAMVEGDMGQTNPNASVGDIQEIAGYGLTPFSAFINRIATNPSVWRQLVRNNARLGASTYAMTAPHRIDDVPGGWYDPAYAYARTNTLAVGCAGSGVDAPVYLYVNNPPFYRQVIWDQRDFTVSNGRKFNYLVSPNNSYNQQLLTDTRELVRSLEDNGHEPDVYGVVLYGLRPVDLTPESTNLNGVVQANWTITGLAYYLLKHRDGEPGSLDLFATAANGTAYARDVTGPVLTNASQLVPFSAGASNFYTLTLTNRSPWLDYAAVLRARTGPGQAAHWNITFRLGGTDITSTVLSDTGRVFLAERRLLPLTGQQVTLSLSPKGAPTPLSLVVEALPHAGVDHALDLIGFQFQTNQTPPTLALPTLDRYVLQGQPLDPLWFTVGDAETLPTTLTVSALSSNQALVPTSQCVLGQSGVQRVLTVTPVVSAWGMAPITVTASDGTFTVSKTFRLFVERTNIVPVLKANNTLNLNQSNSWVGQIVPGLFDLPVWTNLVTGPSSTVLGDDLSWAGIRIHNPGGPVTIGGTHRLTLGLAGIDMSNASQDLTLDAELNLEEATEWNVASGRTLTVEEPVAGAGGFTKSGSGNLLMLADNSFIGQVSVTAGYLLLQDSGQQSSTVIDNNAVLRIAHSGSLGTGGLTLSAANNETGRLELSNNISVLAGKTISLNGRSSSTAAIRNLSGTNTVAGTLSFGTGGGNYWVQSDTGEFTLSGKVTSAATGGRTLTLRGTGNGVVSGVIENGSATMSVAKADSGTWRLTASNSYSGITTVSAGTLLVDGTLAGAGAVSVQPNATLGGTGGILGPVDVLDGGILAPGAVGPGALAISNSLTLANNSFTVMEISKSPKTNDAVVGLASVTYGGTLIVTNLGGTLLPGDSFKLFEAGSYTGGFAAWTLPPLPADLGWINTLDVDGTIAVVITAPPVLTWQQTTPGSITLSWQAYQTNYQLESQTNPLHIGLNTNWFAVPGLTTNPTVLPVQRSNPAVFFRLRQQP